MVSWRQGLDWIIIEVVVVVDGWARVELGSFGLVPVGDSRRTDTEREGERQVRPTDALSRSFPLKPDATSRDDANFSVDCQEAGTTGQVKQT